MVKTWVALTQYNPELHIFNVTTACLHLSAAWVLVERVDSWHWKRTWQFAAKIPLLIFICCLRLGLQGVQQTQTKVVRCSLYSHLGCTQKSLEIAGLRLLFSATKHNDFGVIGTW